MEASFLIGGVVGTGLGYWYASNQNYNIPGKVFYVGAGAIAGFCWPITLMLGACGMMMAGCAGLPSIPFTHRM